MIDLCVLLCLGLLSFNVRWLIGTPKKQHHGGNKRALYTKYVHTYTTYTMHQI